MADIKLLEHVSNGKLALSCDEYPDRLMLPYTITMAQDSPNISHKRVKTASKAILTSKDTLTQSASIIGGFLGQSVQDTIDARAELVKYLRGSNLQLHLLDPDNSLNDRYLQIEPSAPSFNRPPDSALTQLSVAIVCNPAETLARYATTTQQTLTNGGALTLTNEGNLHTYPVLTFTATSAVTGLVFSSAETGLSINISSSISSGDVIILDCENLTATKNGIGINNEVGLDFRKDFQLVAGSNTFNTDFTGSLSFSVSHRKRWA